MTKNETIKELKKQLRGTRSALTVAKKKLGVARDIAWEKDIQAGRPPLNPRVSKGKGGRVYPTN